jgi:hypothetical protein
VGGLRGGGVKITSHQAAASNCVLPALFVLYFLGEVHREKGVNECAGGWCTHFGELNEEYVTLKHRITIEKKVQAVFSCL